MGLRVTEKESTMTTRKMVVYVVLAGVVGALVGPPVVQAATTLVKIQDSRTKAKARVTGGALWVDAGSVRSFPNFVIDTGTGSGTVTSADAIVSDYAGSGILRADVDCDGSGGDMFVPTIPETLHAFESGVFVCGPITVETAGNWAVYGEVFGGAGAARAERRLAALSPRRSN
jgi:hypothetical protein